MPSHQPTAGHEAIKPEYLSSQPSPMASKLEPNRNKNYDPKKPHITDTPLTRYNWYKHVNWLNVTLIVLVPVYGMIGAFWTPLYWQTAVFVSGAEMDRQFILTLSVYSLLLCNWSRYHSRLSSPLGTHFLLGNMATQSISCCGGRRCCRRKCQMVGKRSSCSSPLYRYRKGSILSAQGSSLFSFWMDVDETKPKKDWPYGYF